jgi:hypothetical protein
MMAVVVVPGEPLRWQVGSSRVALTRERHRGGGALLVQRDSPHLVALPSQNAAASKRPFRAPQMGFPHGCAKSQRSYEIELRSRPGMQRC